MLALAGLAVVLIASCFLLRNHLKSPATYVTMGVALEVFSGNWSYFKLPIGLDRVFVAIGVVMALRLLLKHRKELAVRGDMLLILAMTSVYLTLSAYLGGTLQTSTGLFSLLDRAGLVPFIAFALAPLLYRKDEDREVLLRVLTVVGGYLGFTAVAGFVLPSVFVWPSYISDPSIGIHYGRARGPFLESAMNGLVMTMTAVAAGLSFVRWKAPLAKFAAGLVLFLCALGAFLTLTRAVWLAFLVALIVGMAQHSKTRRFIAPGLATVGASIALLLAAVPAIATKALERGTNSLPVFDRLNTNQAAVRAGLEHPLFGIGLERFRIVGTQFMEQADSYPLTGAGLIVHNVFLSNFAELGILGLSLWLVAFVAAIVVPVFRRRPSQDDRWRIALSAVLAAWFVVSMLGPTTAAMPTFLLWLWAGIVNPVFSFRTGQDAKDTVGALSPTPEPSKVASP